MLNGVLKTIGIHKGITFTGTLAKKLFANFIKGTWAINPPIGLVETGKEHWDEILFTILEYGVLIRVVEQDVEFFWRRQPIPA